MPFEPRFDLYALHDFFAAIILEESGPEWSNQCGGTMCSHPTVRGLLFPLPVGHVTRNAEMGDEGDPLCNCWFVPGDKYEPTGPSALERVEGFLRWADLDDVASPDSEHAGPFGEAWVPVKFKELPGSAALFHLSDRRCILTYENSD